MWNATTLTPPPINSFHAKSITIDLKAVTCILNNGIKSLNVNEKLYKALHAESLLLSRCVYRMKLQFRSDKGFKYMEKTNTLLKKFLAFDLISDLKSFNESVPKIYEKDLYLPTKQMLEYVLVRMQGYVQLLKRIGESAVNTAELMNNRLGLGHLWATAAVVLGLISRIWQICKYLTKKCCVIYNDLLPLRNKLESVGVKWLEDGYEFPPNLIDWLDVDWLYERADVVSNFQIDLPLFNLLDESDDEDVQYCYQYKLNDCVVVDDESILDDDDVKWVDTIKNQQNCHLDYVIDDSDSSSIEMKTEQKVDFGGNITDSSDDGVVEIKSKCENINFERPILVDDTLEIIDSIIEADDDIGESVSREGVTQPQSANVETKKKNKKKKKKKNRNLEVQQPIRRYNNALIRQYNNALAHQYNNTPNNKKKNFPQKKFKSEGHYLESKSVKIKKETVKQESKASIQALLKIPNIKKEIKKEK